MEKMKHHIEGLQKSVKEKEEMAMTISNEKEKLEARWKETGK